MRRRTTLIVPIRDRRQHKRVLTLKNFGRLALAVAVLFLALTIRSSLRRPAAGDYGRLFAKQVSGQTPVVHRQVQVVSEAPAEPAGNAPPAILLVPAAAPPPVPVATPVVPGSSVVSGPNGVTIGRAAQPSRPLLSGGIFRQ